ncbi:MAG TPA: Hsp20/alpha crystallin family protein, partial [Gammaproteobacteria bacterium]|nr:Hsp20/alpha crystallin family protein [Gammaproteobacteria bacterium]
DVIDRDNDILVRAEIPGVAKEDLDLSLNDRTVTLRGTVRREQKKEEGDYYFAETSQGEFSRTVALPAEVDGSKAKASYRDGVVELTLPKAETAKRHRIPIESE